MRKLSTISPSLLMLCAILAGALVGWAVPALAQNLRPLGELFIAAIRLLAGPAMFFAVASGIAAMRDLRQLRETGFKAIFYFEMLALLALACGLAGAWLLQPGVDTAPARPSAPPVADSSHWSILQAAFVHNTTMYLLLCGILFGAGLAWAGPRAHKLVAMTEGGARWLAKLINLLLKTAPFATFGAIAVTVSNHGVGGMTPLVRLLGALYGTTAVFVIAVLGAIAWCCGYSLWRFVVAIRSELLIVVGTSSSLAAMPRLMEALEKAGCAAPMVRVLVPVGYCFNLCGSNIYMTLALVFLAQMEHLDLSLMQYALILGAAMLTSKGASGVTGSSFVALGAMLAVVPGIPASGLLFIFGIERLLKCRSVANYIGNGVGCIALCAWMGRLDRGKLARWLSSANSQPRI